MMKFRRFSAAILKLFLFTSVIPVAIGFGISLALGSFFEVNQLVSFFIGSLIWAALLLLAGSRFVATALKPVESLYLSLDHLASSPTSTPPPHPENYGVGREIVEQILKDIYDLSSGATDRHAKLESINKIMESIIDLQTSAIVVIDRNQLVSFVNNSAMKLMPHTVERATGLPLDTVFQMEFPVETTLSDWLAEAQAKDEPAHNMWEKVRIANSTVPLNFYDVVVDFTPGQESGLETIIVFVDKTETYDTELDNVNFTAMAAHELRSPIGLLRGYIEVFEDEIGPNLDDEQKLFMQKMSAAAARLSTFISNILNVSKIESGELSLKLLEDTIYDCINSYMDDFRNRVSVHKQQLILELDDHIPSVGIDRVALYEVLSNLIDNAIKYNRPEEKIVLKAKPTSNGGVSVSVQDFGIGIPSSSMQNLFERFYRSHHSRKQISGNGLGLFLSKRIIEAHGGTIWVNSQKGEGSTFGFDLPSYADLSSSSKQHNSDGTIIRTAHGWIKNHGKVRHS